MTRALSLAWAAAVFALATPAAADPKYVIRMATAAPDGTTWARELRAFTQEVEQTTRGEVRVKLYFGGIAGDELESEERMRRGQLDGVASGGMLCQKASPSFRVMRLRGLFDSPEEASYVINRLKPIFDEEFLSKGYVHLGFAILGEDLLLTRDPVRSLDELKRVKLWRWNLDEQAVAIDREIGLNILTLPVEEGARAFDEHRIDGFVAVPSAALAFQWFSRARYLMRVPLGYLWGCMMVTSRSMDRMPLEHRQALQSAVAKLGLRLDDVGTRQDAQLVEKLFPKQGMTTLPVPDKLREDLIVAARKAVERLGDRVVPKDLLEKTQIEIQKFRAEHKHARNP